MKKGFLRTVAACGITIISLATLSITNGAPKLLNGVKAVVNGEIITQVDLDEAVKAQVAQYLRTNRVSSSSKAAQEIAKIEKETLQDLIDRKLILSEFKAKGFQIKDDHIDDSVNGVIQRNFNGDRDKFMESLNKQGMSLNQFRKVQEEQIAIRALQSQLTHRPGDAFVLPHEENEVYEEIKGDYRGEGTMRFQMITIPKLKPLRTKEQQKELIYKLQRKIASGERFSSIAKDYSADQYAKSGGFVTGPNGERDFKASMLSPNMQNAAKGLGLEKVSKVIDDGVAWRLIMVNSRRSGSTPSKKELNNVIQNLIASRKKSANMDGWIKKLRKNANIRVY